MLAPPPKQTVSEWADAERFLSSESAAEHGKWRTDRAPYQRGILDAFSDPTVSRVIVKTSSQVGKTEILLNVLGYHIDKDPCPILLVQPTLDLAKDFSKDRIAPMLRDTPSLAKKLASSSRDSGNTLLNKSFPGGYVALAGANSAASLAGRPIRIVLMDEVDRYPASAGTEGDPVDLAIKRTTTFFNRKVGLFSTPTTKGASKIDNSYEASDKRERHVPCPHCGHMQPLEWEQLKFEGRKKGEITNIRYECISCHEGIDESEKYLMDRKGEWVATAPFYGIAGFALNELISPWVRWVDIIEGFFEARKDPDKFKVWWNTSLGRVFEIRGEAPEWKKLYDRREKFPLNVVPPEACLVTASCDVQRNRLEAMVVAWARDKQNWTIARETFVGNTSEPEVWLELDSFLAKEFPHAKSGVMLPIRMLAVDSSDQTSTVYSWARKKSAAQVAAIKGQDNLFNAVGIPKPADVTTQGKRHARSLLMWPIGVSKIKQDLYAWLKIESPLDGKPYQPCYCHFPEFDDEFFKQLTAEDYVKSVGKNKFAKYEWVKNRDRNEVLDLWTYAKAAAVIVGLDRMTDEQWTELEEQAGVNVSSPRDMILSEQKTESPKEEKAFEDKVIDEPEEAWRLPRRESTY